MKATVTSKAIEFDGDVDQVKFPATDDLMCQISEQLGQRYGAVKLSGYWVVGTYDPDPTGKLPYGIWCPLYGHLAGQQTRKFSKALCNALNRPVVSQIPVIRKFVVSVTPEGLPTFVTTVQAAAEGEAKSIAIAQALRDGVWNLRGQSVTYRVREVQS